MQRIGKAFSHSDTLNYPVLLLRLAQDLHHALPANLLNYQPRSIHSRLIVDSRSPAPVFDTKADAPASKNAWLAAGSLVAVNMITFVVVFTRVISRHASSE